jgi:hypothetical protein
MLGDELRSVWGGPTLFTFRSRLPLLSVHLMASLAIATLQEDICKISQGNYSKMVGAKN